MDYKLDALSRLYRALRKADRFRSPRERFIQVLKNSGLHPYVVKELIGHARRYDPAQVRTSIEALALVDARVSAGERDLILETLVALCGLKRGATVGA